MENQAQPQPRSLPPSSSSRGQEVVALGYVPSAPAWFQLAVIAGLSFPLAAIPVIVWLGRRSVSMKTLTARMTHSIATVERELVACKRRQQQLESSISATNIRIDQVESQTQFQSDQLLKSGVNMQQLLSEANHFRRRHSADNESRNDVSSALADIASLVEEVQRGLGVETPEKVEAIARLRGAALRLQQSNSK